MKVPTYEVEYVNLDGVTQSVVCESIKANYSMGDKKDTFALTLPYKPSDEYTFEPNEVIRIKMGYTGNNALVMDGIITEVGNTIEEGKDMWSIKGNNILEILLNHQVRADYDDKTAGFIIDNLLQQASDSQPVNRQIQLNTSLSNTSSATKVVDYYAEYKPVFQHIETVSQNQYTGDGDYIYYLDQDSNQLVWKPKPTTPSGTILQGEGISTIKRTKNEDEVLNFIFINAGPDLNDASINTYQTNITSINKLGYRTKYVVKRELANWLKSQTNPTDNSQFREDVKTLARLYGQDVLDSFDDGTDKAIIQVQGTTGYSPGQQYGLVLEQAGFSAEDPKLLYLDDVQYSFDKRGYWTVLKLKEDIRSADPSG